MEKRYQVFISSTFIDLLDERQSVLRAILELDHMPAGMELFPAADESAWQLIKDVIDASDYYVVIVGGRYGSLDEQGIGYTEKEYDYALQSGKPVLPLLHEKPDTLAREKTETDAAAWKKLQAFRAKVEKRHTCVYWKSAEDLKAKVIVGITTAIKRHPAVGWVRADKIPSEATLADVLALRTRVSELEKELARDAARPPKGTEDLLQGDDTIEVKCRFSSREAGATYPFKDDKQWTTVVEATWDEVFAAIAPMMINEAGDADVRKAIQTFFTERAKENLKPNKDLGGKSLVNFTFQNQEVETVIVQFRALGLIEESIRPRSVKDTKAYWHITKHGDNLMTKLRALRRTAPEPVTTTASPVPH